MGIEYEIRFRTPFLGLKLLDQYGMQLIVGEMCEILIVGTLAMMIDRRRNYPWDNFGQLIKRWYPCESFVEESSMPKTWQSSWTKVTPLGQGGQCETFKVSNDTTGQVAVLKLLKKAKDLTARSRMVREVVSLQALGKATNSVPKVYEQESESWQDTNVELYMVMEFVPGATLQAFIDNQKSMNVDVAIILTKSLCDTISTGHQDGILHRDLKPENIILRNDDVSSPVVIDYGLSFNNETGPLTEASETFKSTFLILPEATAKGGAIKDPRSDLTAICAVLYFCLTGNRIGPLYDEHSRLVHYRPGHTLSESPIASDSRIGALNALFNRGLAYQILNRFQTIDDLRKEIDGIQSGNTTGGETDPIKYAEGFAARMLAKDRKSQIAQLERGANEIRQSLMQTFSKYHIGSTLKGFQVSTIDAAGSAQAPKIPVQPGFDVIFQWEATPLIRARHHPHSYCISYAAFAQGLECQLVYCEFEGPDTEDHGEGFLGSSRGGKGQKVYELGPATTVITYTTSPTGLMNLVTQSFEDWLVRSMRKIESKIFPST